MEKEVIFELNDAGPFGFTLETREANVVHLERGGNAEVQYNQDELVKL